MIGSGLSMEEMIFEVADTHLFFNDLEVHGKCVWKAELHVTVSELHCTVCEGSVFQSLLLLVVSTAKSGVYS